MEATRIIQRVIDSNYRLAALQTGESERLLALFKRITLTTGRAVYHWMPEMGLYRLGIEHIFIPRTSAPGDVLSYIAASRHYGIYLLQDFGSAMTKPSVQRSLQELAGSEDDVRRLVLFIGDDIQVPQSLRGDVAVMRHNVRARSNRSAQQG